MTAGKHWDLNANAGNGCEVVAPKVDAFLDDIVAVFAKHEMSIGHEDGNGSFIVEVLTAENVEWLRAACIDLRPAP